MKNKFLTSIIVLLLLFLIKNILTHEVKYFPSIVNKLNNTESKKERYEILLKYGLHKYNKLGELPYKIEMLEYANYAYINKDEAKKILDEMDINDKIDVDKKIKLILDEMVKIEYKLDDKENDILKTPYSTYKTQKGDCEDQAVLAAMLLNQIGKRTFIFHRKGYFNIKGKKEGGHVFVGIESNIDNYTHVFDNTYLKAYELTGSNVNELEKLEESVDIIAYEVKSYQVISNN